MVDTYSNSTIAHYQVLEKLGEGGMGAVYRATDSKLQRNVALKFLPSTLVRLSEYRARFDQEARAAAAINHPNVATVYGIEEEDDEVFIAMEYIDGETIQEKVTRSPVPIPEVIQISLQAASALQEAHAHGIVHRDIKSGNIMLTSTGQVKITDFGLARHPSGSRITTDGTTMGTIAYIAPEQVTGEGVDSRADLWSLGVVMYEMIAGVLPFHGDYEQAILYGIMNMDPKPLTAIRSDVPLDLEWIVNKLLAKDRNERYQHADDLIVDLKAVELSGNLLSKRIPNGVFTRSVFWPEIPRSFWIGAVSGLVIGILLFILVIRPGNGADSRIETDISELSLPLLPSQSLKLGDDGNDMALSPDGTLLAYISENEEVQESRLLVKKVGSIEPPIEILNSSNADHPFFSLDGKYLGFYADGTFKRLSTENLDEQPAEAFSEITGIPRGATFLDEQTIVFAEEYKGLFSISPTSTEAEPILPINSEKGDLAYYWPSSLPDGKSIVFTVWNGENLNQAHIAVLDISTGTVTDLEIRGANAHYHSASGHLLYCRWDNNETGQVVAVPFDPEKRRVTGSERIVRSGIDVRSRGAASFTFSQSGRLAWFDSRANSRRLVWVNRIGERDDITEERRNFTNPVLSPDGRFIAVDIDGNIWLFNIQEKSFRRLTEGGVEFEVVWHPSGTSLVYSSEISGRAQLYRHNLLNGDVPTLLFEHEKDPWASSWSPDGSYLAYYFRKDQSNRDIYVWSEAENRSIPLLTTPANERAGVFSPDGEWLAYISDESGQDEIWVVPFPGNRSQAVRVTHGGGTEPRWWPKADFRGQLLSYRKDNLMMRVEVETSGGFRILSEAEEMFSGHYFSAIFRSQYDIRQHEDRFLMIAEDDHVNQINVDLRLDQKLNKN